MRALLALACVPLLLGAAAQDTTDVRVAYRTGIPAGEDRRVLNVTADSEMPTGNAVGVYSTVNKYAEGGAFGAVFEVQDVWGKGTMWGLETDCFTTGTTGVDPWLRHCVGIVIGRSAGRKDGRAMVGYGLEIAGNYNDRGSVEVGYGILIHHLPARIAAIAVQAGEKVCLEESGKICLRFNPASNAVEIVNGDHVVQSWGVQ